ncbi:B12-binding domain-containing radical SAM protein [Methylocystis sp.]|uniref:B12-binding domain-containing radical SAM protein n=1 Tax=Methylocystis sp. TaxID=1911079 RepID=UPI003DA46958
MKALLIVPPFWDPVCVPLGISCLKAYAEAAGHSIDLFDFNTQTELFSLQRRYFNVGKRLFPRWSRWNIERNGTEALAMHQILYLYARNEPDYTTLVAELLNMAGEDRDDFDSRLDVAAFDRIFDELYTRVRMILYRLLHRRRYEVVGCSIFNSTWPAALFVLGLVKGLDSNIRTVVGGPGPIMGLTAKQEDIRGFYDAHPFVDYFVVGEGERAFLKILDTPSEPPGILGSHSFNDKAEALPAIDDLPLADYGELDVTRYLQLSAATSRGCPFECTFCAETVFWHGFTRIKPDHAFSTLRGLADRYGRNSFYLCDSLANQVIGPLTHDIQESGRLLKLDCYLRADPICTDPRRTANWHSGGLYRARLGMESASQRILDAMRKMTTPDQMCHSLEALSSAGVMTSTLWMIAYPGETDGEFEETLRFIRDHRSQIYQSDAWLMQYHSNGLAGSESIARDYGSRPRFSQRLNDVLKVTPTVVANDLPPEERFDRLERFVATMEALAIPNPYSLFQWVAADRRWAQLGHDAGWSINDAVVAMNG